MFFQRFVDCHFERLFNRFSKKSSACYVAFSFAFTMNYEPSTFRAERSRSLETLPKTLKKSSPNACAQKRVLAPGDLAWATFQSHFGSFVAAFELQNGAKISKKHVQKMTRFLMIC